MKPKIRKCDGKVCTNFRSIDVPKDDIECEFFTFASIHSLLVYERKYYLQVYLDSCPN